MRSLSPLPRPTSLLAVALVAGSALVAACGGSAPASGSPAPTAAPAASAPPASAGAESAPPASGSSGDHSALCDLLTPDDFAQFGIENTQSPEVNADEYGAYCTFAEATDATARVELDVFTHQDEAAAADTFETAAGESPAGETPAGSPFDEASFAIDDTTETAYLVVRDGTLVIALTATNDINVDQSLLALATLVAQRASAGGG
jgi:hypothetical protein